MIQWNSTEHSEIESTTQCHLIHRRHHDGGDVINWSKKSYISQLRAFLRQSQLIEVNHLNKHLIGAIADKIKISMLSLVSLKIIDIFEILSSWGWSRFVQLFEAVDKLKMEEKATHEYRTYQITLISMIQTNNNTEESFPKRDGKAAWCWHTRCKISSRMRSKWNVIRSTVI